MKLLLFWSLIGVQVLQAAQQSDDRFVTRKRFGSLDSLVSSDSSSHSSSADESGPELCKKPACLSTMRKSFVRVERPYVEHNQDAQGDPLTQERIIWHEAKLEDSAECLKEQFQGILWHSLSADIKNGSDKQAQKIFGQDRHVGLMLYLRQQGNGNIALTPFAISLLKDFLQQSPGLERKRSLWLTYAFSVGIDDASINAVLEQR